MSDVPLRDFIERIIAENNLRRDDLRKEDRRWIEQSIAAVSKALELEAKEIARRLSVLNHAHEEAVRVLNTYVSKATYEQDQKAFAELKSRVDVSLVETTLKTKSTALVVSVIYGTVVVTIMAIGVLVTYLSK